MAVRRQYKGNATPTTLSSGITATSVAFNIDSNAGWPTGGVNGKFFVTFDPDGPLEETVLVQSQSAGACVIASTSDRGLDDTAAADHAAGTVVIHSFSKTDADEANRHITTPGDDDHTQYMRADGTRHDLTARHSAGSVVPTAAPLALTTSQASAEGGGTTAARSAHVHGVTRGTPVATGTALAAGTTNNFADAGHVHTVGVGSINNTNMLDAATLASLLNPTGVIALWGTAAAPTGWQICDGSAISRAANPNLFALWGTSFGAGDGSTTFNVPDMRQRFPLGKAASGTGSTLGGTGGTVDHVHALNTSSSHARFTWTAGGSPGIRMVVKSVTAWTWNRAVNTAGAFADSGSSSEALELGGNSDVANPPFMALNFICRLG